jgi:hypothetical protein
VKYKGEWRVDTHPRFSRDGRLVCIDSPAGLNGRQLWLLDIREILDQRPPVHDEPLRLGGEIEDVYIWGRGGSVRPFHFKEFLPALFERTLVLEECDLSGNTSLEWIFTGDRAGFSMTLTEKSLAFSQRWYDSFGLHRSRHPWKKQRFCQN